MASRGSARIGADIGGTFTDLVLEHEGRVFSTKLLTTHAAPDAALLAGISALLQQAALAPADVALIVHGTTLATNALIERKGARTALLTTEGFRDTLELGSESRFDQYDLMLRKPVPLVARRWRLPIRERVAADGAVLLTLDEAAVQAACVEMATGGTESVAIAFLHSYANKAHEIRAREIVRAAMPQVPISISCEVSPEMREHERFSTTVANAYVQPVIASYLDRLQVTLGADGFTCPLLLMLSSGGMTTVDIACRFPVRLVESGPAGGVIFAARIAAECGRDSVLSFDMGGTTAKLCVLDDGAPRTTRLFEVARTSRFRKGSGLPLRIPVIEMVEIGAGGGSIARRDSMRRITVGPESAGSEPGPACYDRGGTAPTVTDADLLLGRIDVDTFAGGAFRLNRDEAETAMATLGTGDEPALLAFGVAEIVDEAMATASRVHAAELGTGLATRSMIAFGGAAPLHAARLAEKLGIDEVIVPRMAGVGSAMGFLDAPISFETAQSLYQRLDTLDLDAVNALLDRMSADVRAVVVGAAPDKAVQEVRVAQARYVGQGHEISVILPMRRLGVRDRALLRSAFETEYRAQFGVLVPGLAVEIPTWVVRAGTYRGRAPRDRDAARTSLRVGACARPVFDPATGRTHDFAIFRRAGLHPGDRMEGPCLISEAETTTVVPPSFTADVDASGHLVLRRRPT